HKKLEYSSAPAIEATQLQPLSIKHTEHSLKTKPYVSHSINEMLNGKSQADRRIQSVECMPLCDTIHIPKRSVDHWSSEATPSVGTRALKAVHEEKTSYSGRCEHNPGTKSDGEKQFQCRTWSAPLSTLCQSNNRQLEMLSREAYTNACTSEAEDQPLDLSLKRSFTQLDRGSLAQIINYPVIRNGICPTDPFALEQTKATVSRDRPYSTPFDFIFRQKYHQTLHTLLTASEAATNYPTLPDLPVRTSISDSSRSFVQFFREQWLKKNVASLVHQKMGRRPGMYRDRPPPDSEPTTSKINSTADAATITSATRFTKIKCKYGMSITRDHPPGKPLRRPYTEAELSAAVRAICFGRLGTRRAASVYGIPRSTLRNKICKLNELKRREEERQGGQTILMPDFLQGLLQQMREKSAAGRTATSSMVARGAFTIDERQDSVDYPFSTDDFVQLNRRGPEVQKPTLRISVTPNRAASIF
ncbi:helix-turn-helix protein, partial [Opisthorchis viverrini]